MVELATALDRTLCSAAWLCNHSWPHAQDLRSPRQWWQRSSRRRHRLL